jgi:hypothetical protein
MHSHFTERHRRSDENIVHPPAFAIHGDGYACILERLGELVGG